MALLGDVYFYISAIGFAASCALFGFFLRQYRLAANAVDDAELEPLDLPRVVPLVPGPSTGAVLSAPGVSGADVPPPLRTGSGLSAPGVSGGKEPPSPKARAVLQSPEGAGADVPLPVKTEPAPAEPGALKSAALAALPSSGPATPRPKSETTFPGGISPAIVYLQSVKSQLEILEKEVTNLKSLASKQSGQEELILKKLGELSEQIKASASRPAPSAPAQMRPPAASVPVAPQARPPVRPPAAVPAPITLPPMTASPVTTPPPAATPPVPTLAPEPAAPQSVVPGPDAAAITPSPLVTLSPLVEPPAAAVPAEPAPAPAPAEAAPLAPVPEEKPLERPSIMLDGIPQQGEASAENKPVRRGPVWPI
ncbi:MAG: hypothetical protein HZB91_05925 [Elusimicrobia bacterium]|nr:hypothetical protein [Elusimicrobiota bacterium]